MLKLKSRFVNDLLVNDRGFRQVHTLFRAPSVIQTRYQVKAADAGYVGKVRVVVARDQSVVRVELVIDTRAKSGPPVRSRHSLAERRDVQVWVENDGVDDRIVIDIALLKVHDERSLLLLDWTT